MNIEEKLAAELARTWGHDVPPLDYRVIAKRLAPAVEQIALEFAADEIDALVEEWEDAAREWSYDRRYEAQGTAYPRGFRDGWDHAGVLLS